MRIFANRQIKRELKKIHNTVWWKEKGGEKRKGCLKGQYLS